MTTLFVPPHPPRGAGPVAGWRGLIGERGRTAVYGWSEKSFEIDQFTRKVFGFTVHVINNPDLIQQVLQSRAGEFVKPAIVKRLLGPTIGEGLLTAEGDLWRAERKIVAASFAPAAIELQRPLFEQAAEQMMASWSDGDVIDMAAESTRATMTVIALALFGGDSRLTDPSAMASIAAALEGFSQPRMQAVLGLPLIPIGPKAWAGARGQRFLRKTLAAVVEDRRTGKVDDWLAGLVRALDAHFPPEVAWRLAIDNAATFYLAGHETTSNALGWTLFLLGEQPELQEELAAEARAALDSADWRRPGLIDRLPRLHAALQESMRLYPPVPRIDRESTVRGALGEAPIAPGDIVSIWPWLVHRHRKLWDEPDTFVADRFSRPGERHRFQYLPFGGGPRICVGAHFATIEALSLLTKWLSQWRFSSIGAEVRVSGLVTLRPAPAVSLKLQRR